MAWGLSGADCARSRSSDQYADRKIREQIGCSDPIPAVKFAPGKHVLPFSSRRETDLRRAPGGAPQRPPPRRRGFEQTRKRGCFVRLRPRPKANEAATFARLLETTAARWWSLRCAAWGATEVCLPPGREWQNVFTGGKFDGRDRVRASDLFADFPVCVLIAGPRASAICTG